MLTHIKRSSLLLLFMPVAALAAPVTVTTHSTGTIAVDPTVAVAINADALKSAGKVPYELTMTSTFEPLPGRSEDQFYDAQVSVDFHLADADFHFAGTGTTVSSLGAYSATTDDYAHIVGFFYQNPKYFQGFNFYFKNQVFGPTGSLGAGGYAPGHLEGSGLDDEVEVQVGSYGRWGNYELSYMNGDIATYSVDVTSPVPEPAAYAMLAAGLLTLQLRRRLGRTRQRL